MKLLFLDIDGVLCCRRPGVIQQNLTQNLATIVKKTGCQIVLSSDWRRFREGRVEASQPLINHPLSSHRVSRADGLRGLRYCV